MAPIALFVYNRLVHTQKTVSALRENVFAKDSDLFVFSDAPKNISMANEVTSVRAYIKTISGFKSVTIIEREENLGLAKSIVLGVTDLTKRFGRVIVLEDDLVTSKYFLQYMNDALDYYNNEFQVMHISGYMFPIESKGLPSIYFLRTASCWGWATWERAWKNMSIDPNYLMGKLNAKEIKRFNLDGSYNFWNQVVLNQKGIIKTWAVFWYATVFQNNGLCLHPAESLVVNIGTDGTGVHCGETDVFGSNVSEKPIENFTMVLAENNIALERTKRFLRSLQPSWRTRTINMLRNVLKVR